jgi:glutathione S-transferase
MTGLPDPILYSFRRCPFAIRARLALAVAGLRCELREVTLRAKPAAMLEASPKGTVPVLVLPSGKIVDESLDIMRWALERRDPEGWLERDDPGLIAANDGSFKQDLDQYKYAERHGTDRLVHRERAAGFLRELEARLAVSAQLAGPARGLADAAIVPFVRQFAAVERSWFELQPLPNLQAWLGGHLRSGLFAAGMLRTPAWSPGDPPVAFPAG